MFGNLTSFESSLFEQFRRLQDEMDELFGQQTWPVSIRSLPRGTFPGINVGATSGEGGRLRVRTRCRPERRRRVPAAKPSDDQQRAQACARKNAAHYRQERFGGEFRRVVSLPDDIDPDQVEARYSDGILQISIRRREASRPRQIQIH